MTRDRLYLLHILESIQKIEAYTRDGRSAFLADARTRDAVARNFEIIGEATKQLSTPAKSRAPDVPWRAIAGLRDVLIHRYADVDDLELWNIVEHHFPPLRLAVQTLLTP